LTGKITRQLRTNLTASSACVSAGGAPTTGNSVNSI